MPRPIVPALLAVWTAAACTTRNPAFRVRASADAASADPVSGGASGGGGGGTGGAVAAPAEASASDVVRPEAVGPIPDAGGDVSGQDVPRIAIDAASPAAPREVDGLLGYWAFEDAADSATARDSSRNRRDAMVEGKNAGLALIERGYAGRGLSMPGGSSTEVGVRIPYTTAIDLQTFTVAVWFKLAANPPATVHASIISRQLGTTNREIFNLTCSNGDVIGYIPGMTPQAPQSSFEARAKGVIKVGAWMHAALTYDAQTLRLYIDGEEKATGAFAGRLKDITADTPIFIGTNKNTTFAEPFFGEIDEVALYGKAVAPETIQQLAMGRTPFEVLP